MGKIYYIMGKSASGKDSIFKELKKRMPQLREIVLYTTRPIRENETEGVEYHFVNEEFLRGMQEKKRVIELRSYDTKCGIWKYFTADDGQIDLEEFHYLAIGTLESYAAMTAYFGVENVVPIYVEVEDGLRLLRAVERERLQTNPKYAELCRRFLADSEDFSEKNLITAGIKRRFQNVDFDECIG
ncbi:MAG: guanylate kinase, partial [Schaedlerella sp.]|uniref:guanylate kinase n=1 Tax=Schaedlerella sp. TaxID=2676057 RepID=UPI00352761A1